MQTLRDLAAYLLATEWATPPLEPHTHACYVTRLVAVTEIIPANTRVTELKPEMAQKCLKAWTKAELARATIVMYMRVLRRLIDVAQAHNFCLDWKLVHFKLPRAAAPERRMLTRDECDRLLAAVAEFVRERYTYKRHVFALWVEFSLETGLRRSETLEDQRTSVKSIRAEDLRPLRDRHGREDGFGIRIKGKGRKERLVPLSPRGLEIFHEMCALARKHMRPLGALFHGLTTRIATSYLRECSERANLGNPRVTPHCLRRAYATAWIEDYGDPVALQSTMGHKHFTTTQGYIGDTTWRVPESARRVFAYRTEQHAFAQGGGGDVAGVPT